MKVFFRFLVVFIFLFGVLTLVVFVGKNNFFNKQEDAGGIQEFIGSTSSDDSDLANIFDDFLNKNGNFTEIVVEKKIININRFVVGDTKLGIVTPAPHLQGWLFDYIYRDNRLFLLVGFDSFNEKRLITLVQVPLYLFSNSKEVNFYFTKLDSNVLTYTEDSISFEVSKDKNNFFEYLNKIKGGPIIFDLAMERIPLNIYNDADDSLREYYDEFNKNIFNSKVLVANLYNAFNYDLNLDDVDKGGVISLTNNNISDVDITKIPLILSNIYYHQ